MPSLEISTDSKPLVKVEPKSERHDAMQDIKLHAFHEKDTKPEGSPFGLPTSVVSTHTVKCLINSIAS